MHVTYQVARGGHQRVELPVVHVLRALAIFIQRHQDLAGLGIQITDLLALRGVLDDHEDPVLLITAGGRAYRGVKHLAHHFVGHRVRLEPSQRPRSMHRFENSDFRHVGSSCEIGALTIRTISRKRKGRRSPRRPERSEIISSYTGAGLGFTGPISVCITRRASSGSLTITPG